MELTELFGFAGALVIGVTLGLIGGGGSILTVPVLVYLMGVSPVLATAYSLFIVGVSSLVGALGYMKKGLLSYKTAIVFAIPSFIAVFLTRKFLVPMIPQEILTVGGFILTKDIALMIFFALIMLLSAVSMLKDKKGEIDQESEEEQKFNYPMILLEGVFVGTITGIVGAGGGFLIIPALVLLARLPMKLAIGTSLLIITVKSLIGFLGDIGSQPIDWTFLGGFTVLSIGGIFLGTYISKFIPGSKLKKGFGWFVIVMGIYILLKELVFI
ncbi:sulfite exporter TauE/SafE family protein [Xanthovirga aplysinae]|uniref:sulfite exporter TauE/SafE family protein n=1 Tax=Xanthovirga aplysinae TaxID=2529853 RepID=UPI0012BB99EC|nr:sulfite exporter TauE/SafE family protein [Xanthovirga aplysinae]MTI32946.1 sulfite exporter TauE/SafE family protein [Xanthovirga aplysinae]